MIGPTEQRVGVKSVSTPRGPWRRTVSVRIDYVVAKAWCGSIDELRGRKEESTLPVYSSTELPTSR